MRYIGSGLLVICAACGSSSSTPDAAVHHDAMSDTPVGGTAHINVTWTIKDVDGTITACPTGFDTGALYSQATDTSGNPIGTCQHTSDVSGTCFIDLFSCSAGAGSSAPLPATSYLTWLQIENHDGSQVYGRGVNPMSPSGDGTLVDVTTADATYSVDIFNDGGHFRLTWDLAGAQSGSPLTCAQAGAGGPGGGVEALSTVSGGSTSASDIFTCEDHEGTTAALAAGSYTVSVDALNASMASVGTAPALTNKTIGVHSAITDLGNITIPIDGL